MKNKFLNICIGVTLVLLGTGFLLRSINTASAAPPKPEQFMAEGTNQIGKYHMQLSTNIYNDVIYYFVIVWDTETGKSKVYKNSTGVFTAFKDEEGLPANPMGN